MKITEFHQKVRAIDPNVWESSLCIGALQKIDITNTITRPYSHVVRCEISGNKGQENVFVKLYRNPKTKDINEMLDIIQRDYDLFDHWYRTFEKVPGHSVVRPVWVMPEEHMLATSEVKGRTLFDEVVANGGLMRPGKQFDQLVKHFHNVGTWLGHFQQLSEPIDRLYDIENLIEYIHVRLGRLTERKDTRFPEAYCDKIAGFLERNKQKLTDEERRMSYTHNDFNLSNIMINGDDVTVLDFGAAKEESMYLDTSRFYHQLYLWSFKPNYRLKLVQQLQEAYLDGYGQPNADQNLLFRCFLIRHTLTHLITATRFWQKSFKEKLYNRWVLHKELALLDELMAE